MPDQFIDLHSALPKATQAVSALDSLVLGECLKHFTPGFAHLLRLHASQINGCAYCIALHRRDARNAGESQDRITQVSSPGKIDLFDARELAALALVERVTVLGLEIALEQETADGLSEAERASVAWTAIVINVWNRFSIISGKEADA